ncbi:MAG: sodium:proton antiporter [Deltaproteobacteria bacterium]|nr:sodium:proton antiporter [Deltaproteobacteria bacterium]
MAGVIFTTLALSMIFGTIGIVLGRRLRVPPILFYLGAGMIAGPIGLNWIQPSSLGETLMPAVELAVGIILFEAGLGLPLSAWKTAPKAIRRTLTLILVLTAACASLLGNFIVGLPWELAVLFGATIVVTGPTVINPVLRNLPLSRKLDVLLRWESVWADCFGVVLSGVVLEWVLSPDVAGLKLPLYFLVRVGTGFLFGLISGWFLGKLVLPWTSQFGDASLPGIVAIGSAVMVFYVSNSLVHGSGVIAVAVAGIFVARFPLVHLEEIRHFKDQISTLIIAFIFVLLSAQVDFSKSQVPLGSLFLGALLLVFIVRPVTGFLGLWKTSLRRNEKLFFGFVGPRGIVSAATASYYAFLLEDRFPQAADMRLLVFTTILIGGGFVSIFGRPLSSSLGVKLNEYGTGISIIGISPFSREFASRLQSYVDVVLIDSDPAKCSKAAQDGLEVVQANALDDQLYESLVESGRRRALVCTPNAALNDLIARRAAAHLGFDRVFVLAPESKETRPTLMAVAEKMIAFTADGDLMAAIGDAFAQGRASIELLDGANVRESDLALAIEEPDSGIRIVRAIGSSEGRGLYLRVSSSSFASPAPVQ